MQTFLAVRRERRQSVGDLIRHVAVPVKSAGRVPAVLALAADCRDNIGFAWFHRDNVVVYLASYLSSSHQHHGGPKEAGVPHKTAGVPDRATRLRENPKVVFRIQIRDGAQPVRSSLIAEDADRFADVIRSGVDIRPKQHGLHLLPLERAQ
jgi:hypothetical protein